MHVTACSNCRKLRAKCIRPSEGRIANEKCQRCTSMDLDCITVARRLGRQPGSKNKQPRATSTSKTTAIGSTSSARKAAAKFQNDDASETSSDAATSGRGGAHHLPNPLHVLAAEARRLTSSSEDDHPATQATIYTTAPPTVPRDTSSIISQFPEWTNKVNLQSGHDCVKRQLDTLLQEMPDRVKVVEDLPVFNGRLDMPRPDILPEYDVISLQIVTLSEAQHLFDSVMTLLTNGSMHFDSRIHTLAYVRSRSSFLLSCILYSASIFKSICPSAVLHAQLKSHTAKMEIEIRNNHYKSVEIVQGFLLLATWQEVPSTLAREKSWLYIAYAITLAVELRMDNPLPYCVQCDPTYNPDDAAQCDLLLRNAHRTCLFLYIHDRNMAMVAGRYPVFPDSALSSTDALENWCKHPQATKWDLGVSASVSLRKLVAGLQHQLIVRDIPDFASSNAHIEKSLGHWRERWGPLVYAPGEYDIISRFQMMCLVTTIVQREQNHGKKESEASKHCERLAFEVVCSAINHCKACTGLLNMATFDISMVTFSALFVVQAIDSEPSEYLSDWSLFRLATLRELVDELRKQAEARHTAEEGRMSVVDAMARQLTRGIRHLLSRKKTSSPPLTLDSSIGLFPTATATFDSPANILGNNNTDLSGYDHHLAQFTLAETTMPFIIDDGFLIDDRFSIGNDYMSALDPLSWNWGT